MFDFYEKRKIRSLVYSKPTIVVIFLLAIALSFSVFERFKVEREIAEKRKETEAELEELREREATLLEKVEYLKNERGIEEELRKRFDVVKEGEQVVVILDDDKKVEKDLESMSFPPGKDTESYLKSIWELLKFW